MNRYFSNKILSENKVLIKYEDKIFDKIKHTEIKHFEDKLYKIKEFDYSEFEYLSYFENFKKKHNS